MVICEPLKLLYILYIYIICTHLLIHTFSKLTFHSLQVVMSSRISWNLAKQGGAVQINHVIQEDKNNDEDALRRAYDYFDKYFIL